jgi:hypothetical protein
MKAHVVIVHWNSPWHLARTLRVFKERTSPDVSFFLIDQSSKTHNLLLATCVLKALTARSFVIQRENRNREGGGYWHYIDRIYDGSPDVIVFTQEEFHQRGMRPKGVPRQNDTDECPYYPDYYGDEGVSLARCAEWLGVHPRDEIGFGGRRCRIDVDYDERFATPYWRQRWAHLDLAWFDFFSGACFCVGPEAISSLRSLAQPTRDDLNNPQFAWMWERMWGTVPAAAGGSLVHYETWENDRVEEFSPDTRKDQSRCSRSISQKLEGSLSVQRDSTAPV